MNISAKLVKELRDKTGAGMMDSKKALVETNGDIEKAIELLREKGIVTAVKKSSRIAAEGLVGMYVSEDKKTASLVEVNSETDFVAKNEEFQEFVNTVAKLIVLNDVKDVEELKKVNYDDSETVEEKLTALIAKIGENMNIRRFEKLTTDGQIVEYSHANGSIGVLVEINEDGDLEAAKNVALQITAMSPEYLTREEVPADVIEKEEYIIKEQIKAEGKPEGIAEKMLAGRLNKNLFEQVVLLEQKYVKENKETVAEYLKSTNTEVKSFARMAKGEGLEKREDNFAEEVAKQMRGEF